uniref:VWFD domain-containing protein n=1 Tax=Megaselia scalaris TaxID=36166 RepID=T1GF21_MEGSC
MFNMYLFKEETNLVKKACPVLQCPISQQIKRRRSDCCPYKCRESKNLRELPNSCFLGDFRPNKSVFYPDKCTNCTCSNGTSVCERTTCPVLECSEQYRDYDKGCCPTCKTSEVRTECTKNGITRQDQESWKEGSCTSCVCKRGEFSCVRMRCEIPKCKHNEHLITPEGECCQQCVESKATCSIFGDPHFKTFDGKFFSFQGSCKYLLTSDCRNHSFSIRLTNDGKNTKTSSWAKTVTLKMGNFRVNLGQKLRVKVNGTRVILPYSDGPIKNIIKLPDGIKLTTHLGVSIEWDGNNFIQIEVPNHYKNMLCGLCGNYNGISRDDFTSRDGTIHTDENEVWRFANSWRVGGKKAYLTDSNIFGKCENIVNPENYVKSCKMDMCECPGGMCFCDSITAYVHECEKMGVVLPNWRNLTKCSTNYWKRSHINKLINYPIMYNNHRVQSSKRKKNHFNSNVINRTHPLQSPEEYFKKHLPEGLLDRNTNRQRSGTPPPLI